MKLVACLTVSIVLALPSAAGAQQPSAPQAKVTPAKQPKLDADALRIPNTIHETRTKPIGRSGKTTPPPPSLPNKFDLGTYDLEFKASHSKEINPRTGYDSGEKANLSNTAPGRKSDSALPDYFGLKLRAPTN